jgi:transposase
MLLPAMPVCRRYKNGRPTKRTPAVIKKLFDAIKEGVPFKLACMYAGITYECFLNWRQKDPDFDRQVDELVAKPAIDLFKVIREQAPETWQAGAWALERRFPEMFAKPEAQLQLNVLAQAAVVNGTGSPRNIELGVVSDLEFVGLKRHPAYKYSPAVRELEGVAPELGGRLEREGNIVVVSQSEAAAIAERMAKIRAETMRRLDAVRSPNQGNDQEAARSSSADNGEHATSLPLLVTAVPSPKPASWWARFIFPGTPLPKADAIVALRLVLGELRIAVDEQALCFQSDPVMQGTFTSTLERLTGSDLGWRTLVQIYERELRRADHRSRAPG